MRCPCQLTAQSLIAIFIILAFAAGRPSVIKSSRQKQETRVSAKSEIDEEIVSFKLHLKQCNLDELEKVATEVSDPSHIKYGKYLTSKEVCGMTKCSDHGSSLELIKEWLGTSVISVNEHCNHVKIILYAGDAKQLFPDISFYFSPEKTEVKPKIMVKGKIILPDTLSQHIQLVTGLNDNWNLERHSTIESNRSIFDLSEEFTDTIVTPRTLKSFYGILGYNDKNAKNDEKHSNRQGVVAFDDTFRSSDVCMGHNMFADDKNWLSSPQIEYAGPEYDSNRDASNGNLDAEYMTAIGEGISTFFLNHEKKEWILDWAIQATEKYPPDKGGPLVWTIGYGFPERSTCSISDPSCVSTETDNQVYLERTNQEFQKLVALGVTVIVSSGNDGASGTGVACPVDSLFPVDLSGSGNYSTSMCPFEEKSDCNCASFVLEVNESKTPLQCILPLGLAPSSLRVPGSKDCDAVMNHSDCISLLDNLSNSTLLRGSGDDDACQAAVNLTAPSFYSNCTCALMPKQLNGYCSLKGYVVGDLIEEDLYKGQVFTPYFPASSPWVTAVGATQVALDMRKSCQQENLLKDLSSAETAISKFTGGFDGGGGFSGYFSAPSWQKDALSSYLNSDLVPPLGTFNQSNRGYPDVSVIGHNYLIVTNKGMVNTRDGTSASATTLAGMISVLNGRLLEQGRPRLGFMNPVLYKMASEDPSLFNSISAYEYDISGTSLEPMLGTNLTVGNNKCSRFSCCELGFTSSESGWDAVTGHGSPNFAKWAKYLGVPNPPENAPSRLPRATLIVIILLMTALTTSIICIVYERRPKLLFEQPRSVPISPRRALLAEMVRDNSMSDSPYRMFGTD